VETLLTERRLAARWWVDRFDLRWQLEHQSIAADPTIHRLPSRTLRRHPDLARFWGERALLPWDVLGYEARAEGTYGCGRLAAIFLDSPFGGAEPDVFALDGDRHSLHRNPPFDDGVEGVSAHLCLYVPGDPVERRWTPAFGLLGLFDLARRHLEAEQVWRATGVWPFEDAPHGAAQPAAPNAGLAIDPRLVLEAR
jgi:hypothetical protein